MSFNLLLKSPSLWSSIFLFISPHTSFSPFFHSFHLIPNPHPSSPLGQPLIFCALSTLGAQLVALAL